MRKLKPHELGRMSASDFQEAPKLPVVVVLDNIRSMHNVGAVFRVADAFLISKLYLCGITATPPHREITKTALGAEETVAWEHAEDTAVLLQRLKTEQYTILAVEQTAFAVPLQQFTPPLIHPYALVFGHEVFGVSDTALALADGCIEIPQHGTKHSLNIASSASIVVWECFKQHRLS